MTNKKVNVILSTYNGEKYLKKQLDSIMKQDYANITLYIRDDGSDDTTVDIIKKYHNNYDNIVFIEDTENLGVPKCFYKILAECDIADYYAFADQDDVWEPNKISRAVSHLEKLDNKYPNLYTAEFDYRDADGKWLRKFELPKSINIYNSIYYTPALGFTIVFNEALRKKLLQDDLLLNRQIFGELHDRRAIRTAAIFGNVICDRFVCAKHIRHDKAVTEGDSTNTNLLKHWIINEIKGDEILNQKLGIKLFLEDYLGELPEETKRILSLFSYNGKRINKVLFPHRLRARLSGEVAIRILFFIGKI